MKKIIALLLITAVCAGSASAQNTSRMKDRARSLDDKINERHTKEGDPGPPGPAPTPAPQPGAPAPATPPPSGQRLVMPPSKPGTQQQAATKLKAAIAALRAKGEVTAEDKKQFTQELKDSAIGSGKPKPESLEKLTDTLLPLIAAKTVLPSSDAKIVQSLVVSLNSGGLSASRMVEIGDEVEAGLTKVGIAAPEAAKVKEQLAVVIADVRGGK
jgi:hypothetical protein